MITHGKGHIVNLSSGQAFYLMPTWGAYASIKLAVGGMSEVMHYELAQHGVKVTTVYPFVVNTGFYDDVESETFGSKVSMKLLPYYSNSPETVGKLIFKAVKKGKTDEMVHPLVLVGYYTRFFRPLHAGMSIVSNWFLSKKN
jgi:short-subunit dehydrogenase